MSEILTFKPRQQAAPKQDDTDRILQCLLAVVAVAERAEAQAYTAHGVSTTNAMRHEFLQAAIHIRRGRQLAIDELTQPPKGAA